MGDSVRVHTRVMEGDKERIQIFTGIVIGRRGRDSMQASPSAASAYGEGVERVFPLHSPRIAKIEVETAGTARRAEAELPARPQGQEAMAVREKRVLDRKAA